MNKIRTRSTVMKKTIILPLAFALVLSVAAIGYNYTKSSNTDNGTVTENQKPNQENNETQPKNDSTSKVEDDTKKDNNENNKPNPVDNNTVTNNNQSPSSSNNDKQDNKPPVSSGPSQNSGQTNQSGNNSTSIAPGAVKAVAVIRGADGVDYVSDPESILTIVNKQRSLSSSFEPSDLVTPNVPSSFNGMKLRKEAAEALERLFDKAQKDGIKLAFQSGYRSYSRQKTIYEGNLKNYGEAWTKQFSAFPGQSEHQTGLAADITSPNVGYTLEQSFGNTKEGKWLAANAAEFGFIVRYLEGKEHITGYSYEPWHLRYVGVDYARAIVKSGLTMEEFFGIDVIEVSN